MTDSLHSSNQRQAAAARLDRTEAITAMPYASSSDEVLAWLESLSGEEVLS